jgi:hypothetical protein
MADNLTHPYNRRKSLVVHIISQRLLADSMLGQVVAIDVLPDDVLLTIFDFYVVEYQEDVKFNGTVFGDPDTKRKIESWQSLVHVCRRWRGLVFGSPRRLKLQLCCTPGTSARMSLDVWPTLPLLIHGGFSGTSVGDIAPKLRHSNRISQIGLRCFTISQIGNVCAAMQVPFPELKSLFLSYAVQSRVDMVPVLHSWVDLPHVCDYSPWMPFHFQD